MKKNIIILIILIVSMISFGRNSSYVSKSSKDIKDIRPFLINSSVDDSKIQEVKINDFSKKVEDIVSVESAQGLFNYSSKKIIKLNKCLNDDYCGMKRRNQEDAYFDKLHTPGHIFLERNLEILLKVFKIRPDLMSHLDWKIINDIQDNFEGKIKNLALELLNEHQENESILVKNIDNFTGKSKASAFVLMFKSPSKEIHAQLINAIQSSFNDDDPNTVISVVEKIGDMKISNHELRSVSKALCQYKNNDLGSHNWKMIKFEMSKQNVNLENICD